jgi:hypothetical protein
MKIYYDERYITLIQFAIEQMRLKNMTSKIILQKTRPMAIYRQAVACFLRKQGYDCRVIAEELGYKVSTVRTITAPQRWIVSAGEK